MDRARVDRIIRVGLGAASLAIFCFGMAFVLTVFYIA
jgi:hypothetical protein